MGRLGLPCRVIAIASVALSLCQVVQGQQQSDSTSGQLQSDIAALKEGVKALQAQQQQIINQVNELKQLLTANASARPSPQPPLPSKLAARNERFRGHTPAQVAIIEFADFECPYCGQFERDIYPQVFSDYIQTGKVKYFYRDLPLPMHPHAMIAARAARCAGEQDKFWEMHDSLFARQAALKDTDMPGRAKEIGLDAGKFSDCLASDRYTNEIQQSAAEAQRMGISGTPTFFIGTIGPNDEVTNLKMVVGAKPYEAFKAAIEDALAKVQ